MSAETRGRYVASLGCDVSSCSWHTCRAPDGTHTVYAVVLGVLPLDPDTEAPRDSVTQHGQSGCPPASLPSEQLPTHLPTDSSAFLVICGSTPPSPAPSLAPLFWPLLTLSVLQGCTLKLWTTVPIHVQPLLCHSAASFSPISTWFSLLFPYSFGVRSQP